MLLRDRGHKRSVQAGPWPLEALARDADIVASESARAQLTAIQPVNTTSELARCAQRYAAYYTPFFEGEAWAEKAPVSDDIGVRTNEVKGACYYLDASHVGITAIPANAYLTNHTVDDTEHHSLAVVILVAHGREIESTNPANQWLKDAAPDIARMRALEIAACVASYIRVLGFNAKAHTEGRGDFDLQRLAVLAGIARRTKTDSIESPFFDEGFSIATISTDYELLTDLPIAEGAGVNPLHYWLGLNGAVSGRERQRQAKRESHLSRYPMEQVKRVDRPTTLIFDDEVPRVPKRAEFFQRARTGDLGAKAHKEVQRFALKHPLTIGMIGPLRALVPYQDGELGTSTEFDLKDPEQNTKAIKSLAHHMGADLVGICEVPDYAWYSHTADGTVITPYHKNAVVMLIDQGYDTMEGASGDDWISGCQSMRGYLRGAEVAGVMADFLRTQGMPARSQTNADSHVLQIPLVLLAGLGELSRIGELVLNPYVGPRFKSVVITTDLPLVADKPIDFGLQEFCSSCLKCARECPVNAIPFGDKVIFNGYEIWKPDVERCTTYRVNNAKGSACGRCMKTCPLNKVVSADGSLVHRVGTWLGVNVRWLKPLLIPIAVYIDDKFEFGKRNPIKRWWQDLEVIGAQVRVPRATNERDLSPDADVSGDKSPVGYYHASDMPAPNSTEPVPTNHKQAVARAAVVETVEAALKRRAAGGAKPAHYIPIVQK